MRMYQNHLRVPVRAVAWTRAFIEPLETRQLLSSIIQPDGTLLIAGTSAPDEITVSGDYISGEERIIIRINDAEQTFLVSEIPVNGLRVIGGAGDDIIRLDNYPFSTPFTANGEAGNDQFYIHDASWVFPTFIGGSGNDTLHVTDLNSWQYAFDGGDGVDAIHTGGTVTDFLNLERFPTVENVLASGAVQYVHGNELNNRIELLGSGGPDDGGIIQGGGGDDVLIAAPGAACQIFGGDGNDYIQGGSGDRFPDSDIVEGDLLFGENGNDTIVSLGGPDTIDGGAGTDSVNGGAGLDLLLSSPGNDTLSSIETTTDDHVLITPGGLLLLRGTGGPDEILVSANIVAVGGLNVTARVNGQEGKFSSEPIIAVLIVASGGDDHIITGPWITNPTEEIVFYFLGGSGSDLFEVHSVTNLTYGEIDGGSGDDTFRDVAVDSYITFSGGPGVDLYEALHPSAFVALNFGLENARGPFGAVQGNELNNRIEIIGDAPAIVDGGGGDDTIFGGGGNDSLVGGDGNDVFDGGLGADTFVGGAGGDTVTYYRRTNDVTVTVGSGANDGEAGETDDVQGDIEWIFGGAGNDSLVGTNKTEAFYGFAGNDTVSAGGGDDVVWGGEGNDSIDAGSGNDFVNGGWGSDIIRGGSGNDQLLGDNGQDWIRGDAGNDVVDGQNHDDTLEGGTGADWIIGGSGTDTADYYNRTANLTITIGQTNGNDGESGEGDTVWSDIEILYGGSGNDRITGTSGSQTLFGFDGDDTLIGGASKDWLYGGNGTDTADDDDLDIRGSIEQLIA